MPRMRRAIKVPSVPSFLRRNLAVVCTNLIAWAEISTSSNVSVSRTNHKSARSRTVYILWFEDIDISSRMLMRPLMPLTLNPPVSLVFRSSVHQREH
ncbi:hypothetical protein BD309DRAFT_965341 [Dichomitus squalens]|nr:hypothetical protein BD309DRAFT_965341 [Dichomitus squalens]